MGKSRWDKTIAKLVRARRCLRSAESAARSGTKSPLRTHELSEIVRQKDWLYRYAMELMRQDPLQARHQTLLARNFYTGNVEHSEYVEQRNGGFYVAGTRVSLDPIVYSLKAGDSPETIRQNFSSLSLEQVYGAIAFYLAHEQEVDANVREGEEDLQHSVPHLSESRPELYGRLERARHEIASQNLAKH